MKIIIGNWKMNGTKSAKTELFKSLTNINTNNKIIVCLPFTLLDDDNYGITIGAQNISEHSDGAYTGDISGQMLKDAHVKYVLVGHSERRKYHNETNEVVKQKAQMAIQNDIVPVICIGENLQEYESLKTLQVIESMLNDCLPQSDNFIIAYEPCWAIGTGKTPKLSEIASVHDKIFEILHKKGLKNIPILYGGSVNADNAKAISDIPHVDGLLIGKASLKSETFLPIIQDII